MAHRASRYYSVAAARRLPGPVWQRGISSASVQAVQASPAAPRTRSLKNWLRRRSPNQSVLIYGSAEVANFALSAALLVYNPLLAILVRPVRRAFTVPLRLYLFFNLLPNMRKSRLRREVKLAKRVFARRGQASGPLRARASRLYVARLIRRRALRPRQARTISKGFYGSMYALRGEEALRRWLRGLSPRKSFAVYAAFEFTPRAAILGAAFVNPWAAVGLMALRRVIFKPLHLYLLYNLLPNMKKAHAYREWRAIRKMRCLRRTRTLLAPPMGQTVPQPGF